MCFRPNTLTVTKKCPNCGHDNDTALKACEKCGTALPENALDKLSDLKIPSVPGAPKAPGAPNVPPAPSAPKAPGVVGGSGK